MDSNFYDILASHYDTMQSDMDTYCWAGYIDSLIKRHSETEGGTHSVVDLGCGTGSVDIPLMRHGYSIIGIDSAEEMLAQATAKDGADKICWTAQDITDFELPGRADCFVSLLDTLDHITDRTALRRIFAQVYSYLEPGGVFIFDVITHKHLAETLADNVFFEDYEDFTLLWVNDFDEDTATNTASLTLFDATDDGTYERYDGELIEKYYPPDEFRAMAQEAGLTELGRYGELTMQSLDSSAERIFLVFGKPKENL